MWWGGESPRLARVLNFMEMLFQTTEANEAFESVFSTSFEELECKTDITRMLKDVSGL